MSAEVDRLRALAADAAAGEREAQHNIIRAELERLLKPLGAASTVVILTVDERRDPADPGQCGLCDGFVGGVSSLEGLRGLAALFGGVLSHALAEHVHGGPVDATAPGMAAVPSLVMLAEALTRMAGRDAPPMTLTRLRGRGEPT